MITLLPLLEGQHVRLEPLQRWHARGLAEASSVDPSLYRWSPIPQGEAEALAYIETALAQRDAGVTAPFVVLRIRDDAVIGSTRLWDLGWWPWPEGHPRHGHEGPDVCEIGYTWLASSAIGTAANTEMKLLLLTHAFEVWEVQSVCFHTDARNERSRAALDRIGARFEGILRAHRLATDDRPRNSARYSITAPEWPGVKHHLQMLLAARERALQL
ncbi:MAG TPA: GNAT family protein [Streptosporangiaceae bacterium]|jgi:RimJ/RimL family protein N-acetyltransferase